MKLSLPPWLEISLQNKILIFCCGAFVIILGFYFVICRPKAAATAVLENRLKQERSALQIAEQEVRDMPDPESFRRQLQEEETRMKDLLPDNEAVTDFLVALNALGKWQNVKIVSIKQNAFIDRKTYYEIPLEMTVAGTYPDLLRFISKMENLRRFNTITKIGAQPGENLLTMQLAVVVYAYGPMPQNVPVKSK